MMHEGVAQLLASVPGLVYSDTGESNIFVDHAPSEPDRIVVVFSMAGGESDSKLPYDEIDFQILTRSEVGTWALDIAKEIYSKLHGLRNTTLPDGTYAAFILSQQGSPYALGADDNGRIQYTVDFRGEAINVTEERA